jgi:flavin reductase (DIM6/NTAB) family NADH-FMN oxidoreductase RutF
VVRHIAVGKHFGINVLGADQGELSMKLSRDYNNRFVGVKWYSGRTGVPLLPDVLARFECQTIQTLIGGDHWIVVGHVLEANSKDGAPLIYANRSYARTNDSLPAEASRVPLTIAKRHKLRL